MIVVDSSVWIAVFKRDQSPATAKFDAIPDKTTILVGDVVLLEVLQGARDEKHAARLEAFLRLFRVVPMLGDAIAVLAASHYRKLRSHGFTIRKTPDLVLATYCIAGGHNLLHQDRDFTPCVSHLGLRVL